MARAARVSGRNRAKTYGKVATARRCVEKPTLPRTAIFGKDINETLYIFNSLPTITSLPVDALFGKVISHSHHVGAQSLILGCRPPSKDFWAISA